MHQLTTSIVVGLAILTPVVAQNPQWGDVAGQVIWDKNVPIPAAAVPAPAAGIPAGLKVFPQVVNPKNNGLMDVFVWLEPPQKGAALPIHPNLAKPKPKTVDIDQPNGLFEPRAVALRDGDTLLAKNSSAINHNFQYAGNPAVNPGGNFIMPPNFQQPIPDVPKGIAALKADRLPVMVGCNIHPWMRATVRIYDHPYFAVTDADGKFALKDAPVGAFRIKVWTPDGWAGGANGKNGVAVDIGPGANQLPPIVYP